MRPPVRDRHHFLIANIPIAALVDRSTNNRASATEHSCPSLWRVLAGEALCSNITGNHGFMPSRYNEIETVRDSEGFRRRNAGFSIQYCISQRKTSTFELLIVHFRSRGDHDVLASFVKISRGALAHDLLVGLRVALLELVEDVEADSGIAAEPVAGGLVEALVQLFFKLLVGDDERTRT